MFYSDSHIHTNYSADVPADRPLSVDDICRAAIDASLSYIAFTDHYEPEEEKRGVVSPFPFPDMVRDVLAAKETYRGQLQVALGIAGGIVIESLIVSIMSKIFAARKFSGQ